MFAWTLVAIAVFAALGLQAPPVPVIEPDSASYLDNSAFRRLGYPAFLDVLQSLDATLRQIMWAQIALYAAATAALGRVLWDQAAPWLAVVMMASLALNPFLIEYQFAIMSESIWLSAALVWLAFLSVLYLRSPSFRSILWFGLITGLLIVIRPASLPFLPLAIAAVVVIPAALRMRVRLGFGLAAGLLATALVGAERLAHQHRHDGVENSQTAAVLFARALLLPAVVLPEGAAYPALERRVAGDLRPVLQAIEATADYRVRLYLLAQYGILGHFSYRPPELDRAATRTGESREDVMAAFALRRIGEQPLAFLAHGAEQFVGLWTILPINTPSGATAYAEFLQVNSPLPFATELPALTVAELPYRWFFPYLQVALWLGGLILLGHLLWAAAALAMRRSLGADMWLALTLNLTVQASFAGIAIVNIAVERFTVVHMPLIALALLLIARTVVVGPWRSVSRSLCDS
ncbi:MAG: hypothetical protein AAF458_12540 [Pseudomonadota bacterium]